jgi:hypothetical protein
LSEGPRTTPPQGMGKHWVLNDVDHTTMKNTTMLQRATASSSLA